MLNSVSNALKGERRENEKAVGDFKKKRRTRLACGNCVIGLRWSISCTLISKL